MIHVLIEDGVVVQCDHTPGISPEGMLEAPDWVCPGVLFDGADFTLPEPPPPPVPDRVSARQFKLQLLASGLIDDVSAWVATQSRAVQIAYEYSGSFASDEAMMQAGFLALGFTEAQRKAFMIAAAKL